LLVVGHWGEDATEKQVECPAYVIAINCLKDEELDGGYSDDEIEDIGEWIDGWCDKMRDIGCDSLPPPCGY